MLKAERSVCGMVCKTKPFFTIVVAGFVVTCVTTAGEATFPSASGGGFFTYDGASLTLSNPTGDTSVTQIAYSPTEWAFFSFQDPVVGGVIELTGVTLVDANTFSFSDGTFTLNVGSDVVLTADIVNTVLSPTDPDTADLNPGLAAINLENVVVAQPSSGTSRFVTDWGTASGGSGLGSVGLTLVNTDSGSLDPLVAPAGGSALFALEPVVPEPASILLMIAAGGWAVGSRRRGREKRTAHRRIA